MIRRYSTARSSVAPLAPINPAKNGRLTQTRAAKIAPNNTPLIRAFVALLRAYSSSPAPSDLATKAPAAIATPIPKEEIKNKIAPA